MHVDEMNRKLQDAVAWKDMTTDEARRAAKALGFEYKQPVKVSATGYLYITGPNRLAVCQNPSGTSDRQAEDEKYVDTFLYRDIVAQAGYGFGGKKVKVTIEEVTDA